MMVESHRAMDPHSPFPVLAVVELEVKELTGPVKLAPAVLDYNLQ
jgi:hypothetical protein